MLTRRHYKQHTATATPVHVIKVGGENASDIRTAEWLAQSHQNGDQLAVAISALRTKPLNTTNELIKARDTFRLEGMAGAKPILENLFKVHLQTLKEAGMHDSELESKLRSLFEAYFPTDYSEDSNTSDYSVLLEQRFVGYGEVMSAHVLSYMLDARFRVANSLIDHSIKQSPGQGTLSNILRDEVGARVSSGLSDGVSIVPGYVSVEGKSIIAAYGRGYTDKMAERIAVGLAHKGMSPVLHIQKQVPLLSSNPNQVSHVNAIKSLSYWSAAEITGARGANAQVLNENTISRELSEKNIPVWVYNPFEKDAPKSVISRDGTINSGIQFVDGRDHVSTITVSGFAMSGPGLLGQLTEFFALQGLAIDAISSSETEVTFTTYKGLPEKEKSVLRKGLNEILGEEYDVEIQNNIGMIYCIGDNLSGHPGILENIAGILAGEGIDIECVTQSRGQRAVTVGVSSENLKRGVAVLHEKLVAHERLMAAFR